MMLEESIIYWVSSVLNYCLLIVEFCAKILDENVETWILWAFNYNMWMTPTGITWFNSFSTVDNFKTVSADYKMILARKWNHIFQDYSLAFIESRDIKFIVVRLICFFSEKFVQFNRLHNFFCLFSLKIT